MAVVVCQCKNAGLVSTDVMDEAMEILQKTSAQVYCVDDMCALSARKDPLFEQWAQDDDVTVLACFPRAVKALFTHAGVKFPESAHTINLREIKGSDPFSCLNDLPAGQVDDVEVKKVTTSDDDWQPWFPVIDYDRCRNCKQCLNFCLFGVYSQEKVADSSSPLVTVSQPHKCKTGCPACARVCPYAAIVFPKYDKNPINGDDVDESQWVKSHAESAESLKDRLSGNNIYQMLRNRKAEPTAPKSISDLEKLKDQFDIPDQLFDSHTKE